ALGGFAEGTAVDQSPFNPYANYPISTSQQTTTGNLAWTEFLFKVSDLQRVGSDTTRTLANVKAIRLEMTVLAATNVQMNSWWAGGTYGPDVLDSTYGVQGFPIVVRYRYRNSKTGAISVQSPALRSGVLPRRQSLLLSGTNTPDPQVDFIDWEAFGGSNNSWHYVGSTPNQAGAVLTHNLTNAAVLANDPLSTVCFQPFPVSDTPKSGTCNTFGTGVLWISGDQFNTRWAAGTSILINGIAHELSAPPTSSTVLDLVESTGLGATVTFEIPEPILAGQPLPYVWGPDQQGRYFGAGDALNPGRVYVTNADADGGVEGASDQTVLEVSSPSEPVLGGVILESGS